MSERSERARTSEMPAAHSSRRRIARGQHRARHRLMRVPAIALVTSLAVGGLVALSASAVSATPTFSPTASMLTQPFAVAQYQQATRDMQYDAAGNLWQATDYYVKGGPAVDWNDGTTGSAQLSAGAESLAVDSTHHRVYTFNRSWTQGGVLDTTSQYNTSPVSWAVANPTVNGSVITGMWRATMDVARNKVYVLNTARNSMWVLDGATRTWGSEISLGAGTAPKGIAYDPTTSEIYIAESGTNTLAVLDASNLSTAPVTVAVGNAPYSVALDTSRHVAYVGNKTDHSVSVVSTTSNTVTNTVALSGAPVSLSVDPNLNYVYVLFASGDASVIDVAASYTPADVDGAGSSGYSMLDSSAIAADVADGLAVFPTTNGTNNGPGSYAYLFTLGFSPKITSGTPPTTGTIGTAYAGHTMTAIGSPTISFSVGSGSLPAGLSLNGTTGVISGTPTGAGGVSTFAINASNPYHTVTSATYTISIPVIPPVLSTFTFPSVPNGSYWDSTLANNTYITATNTTSSGAVSVTSGSLPPGLSLNYASWASSPGSNSYAYYIGGAATTSGTYNFSMTATNAGGSSTQSYSITVVDVAPTISSSLTAASPGSGQVYTSSAGYMNLTSAQSGGTPGTWSVTGTLPTGLSLDTTSIPGTPAIRGTVTAAVGASFTFTVVLTNSVGSDSKTFTVTTVAARPANGAYTGSFTTYEGVPFSWTPTPSGTGPFTYVAPTNSSPFPAGIAVTSSSLGTVSGTPAVGASSGGMSGIYSVSSSVTGVFGAARTGSLAFVVNPAPTNTQSAAATPGQAFSYQVTSSLTGGGLTWSPLQTGAVLPSWATWNTSSGTITGTPPAGTSGSTIIPIRVTDATSAWQMIALTISWAAPLTLPAATLATGTDGTAYSSSAIAAVGGTGPYTYALTNGTSLPIGMTLDPSTGVVSGSTFGVTGTTGFTVTVTDSAAHTATQSYVLTFMQANPSLPSLTLAHGTIGVSYGTSIQASGTALITYSISSGSLPPGITQTGKNVGGTPTQVGSFTFTVSATNDHTPFGSGADTHVYTIVIDPAVPVMTGLASPGGATVGTPYSYTVTPSSGTAPFTFAVTSGTLPAGLTLNSSTGVISGTATAAASSTFTVTATNSGGSASAPLTIVSTVVVPGLASTTTAATGNVGASYSYTVAPSGSGPFTFAVTSGSLPAGLTLNTSTGVISGTPTTTGTASFSVSATNTAGTATTAVTLPVVQLPIVAATQTLPVASTTSPYSSFVAATGAGLTFALANGSSLPAGLSMNSGGIFSGTSTTPGSSTFTVNVTNGGGTVSTIVTLVTQAPPALSSTATAPTAAVGSAYSYTVAPTGTGPFTFAVASGSLPAGLTLNTSTGVISGTATTVGTGSFSITATNGSGSATTAITLPVQVAPTLSATTTLTSGVVGTAFSQSITASGTGPFSYSVVSGSLPAGLTLNPSTGAISGTPTAGSSGTFVVLAANGAGSASTTVSLTIAAPAGLPSATTAAPASVGVAYSTTVTPTGTSPFTFTVASGTLPAGLSLNTSTGVISGTPTTAGVGTFSVTATNSLGSATTVVTLPVFAVPTMPATTSVPSGTVGSAYSTTVTPVGTGPFTFAVASGSLPTGLTLNTSTGVISGTPAATGTAHFSISATNGAGSAATTAITLPIAAAPPTSVPITTSAPSSPSFSAVQTPAPAVLGSPYSASVAGAGTAPITYSISSGALPTGVTLNPATGILSGTPSAAGTFTFQVTATNAQGTAVQQYSVTVSRPSAAGASMPSFSMAAPSSATLVGGSFSMVPQVTAGSGAVTFAVASGALPTGVHLDPSTGAITGTATSAGMYAFAISATNSTGTVTRDYLVTVAAAAGTVPSAALSLNLTVAVGAPAEGAPIAASASGLLPGSSWVLTMHSTPLVLATGTVPASGGMSTTVKLPASIPMGSHMLVINGTSMTGKAVSSRVWFAVTSAKHVAAISHVGPVSAPTTGSVGSGAGATASGGSNGSLATTGFAALPWIGGAGVLLIAGLALLLFGRRRRTDY